MNLNLFVKRIILIMSINLLTGVFCCCAFAGVLLAEEGNAQTKSIREVIISLHLEKAELKTVLDAIEQKTPFRFSYLKGTLATTQDHRLSLNATEQSVAAILETIAQKTGLVFKQVNSIINVKISQKQKEIIPVSTSQISPPSIIEGKVTDEIGEPLAGVNILIKGTSQGTTTDIDGNYRLLVEEGETVLIFSFIGYVAQEVNINGRSVIDISLSPDLTSLQEVTVNAGYWEVDKKEMTGNISKIEANEIQQQQTTNPLQALQGRVPGVYIQQTTGTPGGTINIQIRGQNSLRTFLNSGVDGNVPFYVIDGVPFSFQGLSSNLTNSGIFTGMGSDPLTAINPADIESIEILKDADATAIYGSRGANGVVLITTKKGRAGKTKLDVNISSGSGSVANKLDLLNTEQYLEMRNEAFANDGTEPGTRDHDLNGNWGQNRYTDWQEELIGGNINITNAQVSLSGGNANTTFLLSGTFRRETSILSKDFRFLKGAGHATLNHISSNNKMTVQLSLNYSADNNNQPNADLTARALALAPNAPVLYNEDGSLNWENSTWANPLASLEETYLGKTYTLIANSNIAYEVIPGIHIKLNLGLTSMESEELRKRPSTFINPAFGVGPEAASATLADGNLRSWIIEPQLDWNKQIGQGQLQMLVGTTFQDQMRNASSTVAIGFPSNALVGNILAASRIIPSAFERSDYKYTALFARINYNLNGKYVINLTGRRDGSSRFGPGKQFANFGALGAAWIFSNEEFAKTNLTFLSFGKLRASYGTTGSDQLGNYQFLDTYEPSKSYQGVSGLQPSRLFNPDFAWEENRKFEVGLEVGLLGDRVFLTASYYHNRSSNQLVGIPLPGTTGFASLTGNLNANVQNTGIEFELNTLNMKINDFEWRTDFNITAPRNKLISFPNLESSVFASQYQVDKPLSIRKLYKLESMDPETGVFQFKDFDGDGQITANGDRGEIKELAQEYFGGVNNTLKWRNFQLDFFFQFVKQTGLDVRSRISPGGMANEPIIVLDRWQREGDIAEMQQFTTGTNQEVSTAQALYNVSDAAVGNASFVRLRNVSFSYRWPENLIRGVNGRLYAQGQNILTISDYEGLDPENQNTTRLPPLRILTLGIQLTL